MAQREFYPELPSTQDRAIDLARDGAEDGSVVVAARQLRGRGRGTRSWESPPGGLYLSIVLRPGPPVALLPLAIGSELAWALALAHRVRLRLKWPNDLLSVDRAGRPRKLAGILVDRVEGAQVGAAAVAGIGINVGAPSVGPSLPAEAATLEELAGGPVDLAELERLVVSASVASGRLVVAPGGEGIVLARARGLLYGVGLPVMLDGEPVGTVTGLRGDGALEVRTASGVRPFWAGDVRFGVGR
jgi:BirA family transcriptional regulator, biotin operon repressor / biotin---[acetyl-CoA-carboxylase] ligase